MPSGVMSLGPPASTAASVDPPLPPASMAPPPAPPAPPLPGDLESVDSLPHDATPTRTAAIHRFITLPLAQVTNIDQWYCQSTSSSFHSSVNPKWRPQFSPGTLHG